MNIFNFTAKIKEVQIVNLRSVSNGRKFTNKMLIGLQIEASLVFILKSTNTEFELFPMIILYFTAKIKRYNQLIETNFKQLKLEK